MRYVILIYIISICFINVSVTENSSDEFNNLSLKKNTLCSGQKCIYKCCPFGQYVNYDNGKQCEEHHVVLNFTILSVYNNDMEDTGKSAQEVFKIMPWKFENVTFRNDKLLYSILGYIPYLTEAGILRLEMPNMYDRWTLVQAEDFCVDYLIENGTPTTNPNFWGFYKEEYLYSDNVYSMIATSVSCVFLFLVLVVYGLLPELQNFCGLILMAYVASLFMAFLLLVIVQTVPIDQYICPSLTYGIYFFFLATFCWMSVMSYDIWWTFRGYAKIRQIHRRGKRFKFLMYCLYAWGLPLVMTIGLAVLSNLDMSDWPWFVTPNVPRMGCFFQVIPIGGSQLLYMYIPMLILIIFNWTFFIMTAFNLWRLSRVTAVLDSAAGTPAAHRTHKRRLMVYLKLSVVMGLTWLMEFIGFEYPGYKIWGIFDCYNALTGLVIFLIFVGKHKIYKMLRKKYMSKGTRKFHPGSSRSCSSSTPTSNTESIVLQTCDNPNGLKDNLFQ